MRLPRARAIIGLLAGCAARWGSSSTYRRLAEQSADVAIAEGTAIAIIECNEQVNAIHMTDSTDDKYRYFLERAGPGPDGRKW